VTHFKVPPEWVEVPGFSRSMSFTREQTAEHPVENCSMDFRTGVRDRQARLAGSVSGSEFIWLLHAVGCATTPLSMAKPTGEPMGLLPPVQMPASMSVRAE
jgi:hypothetical protein